MTILFGIDIKYAIGASIVAVIATSSGSAIAFVKDHVSNMRVGMLLEIFTTAGGVVGALMAGMFSSKLLYIFFSLILLNSFYGMLRKAGEGSLFFLPFVSTYFSENMRKYFAKEAFKDMNNGINVVSQNPL